MVVHSSSTALKTQNSKPVLYYSIKRFHYGPINRELMLEYSRQMSSPVSTYFIAGESSDSTVNTGENESHFQASSSELSGKLQRQEHFGVPLVDEAAPSLRKEWNTRARGFVGPRQRSETDDDEISGCSACRSDRDIPRSGSGRIFHQKVMMGGLLPVKPREIDEIESHDVNRSASRIATFYCAICLENVPINRSFAIQGCAAHHMYCTTCIEQYITTQINDGIVIQKCPGVSLIAAGDQETPCCQGVIEDADIHDLTPPDIYSKYKRFLYIKGTENSRECPHCGHIEAYPSDETQPDVTCAKCQNHFCFFHANAHGIGECEAYVLKTMRENMKSTAIIRQSSKPCAWCGVMTQKLGGCNHM